MYNLGRVLLDGAAGVPSNASEAKEWFERAAAAGERADAMFCLGHLLRDWAERVSAESTCRRFSRKGLV